MCRRGVTPIAPALPGFFLVVHTLQMRFDPARGSLLERQEAFAAIRPACTHERGVRTVEFFEEIDAAGDTACTDQQSPSH
jgi:hypothetical protein